MECINYFQCCRQKVVGLSKINVVLIHLGGMSNRGTQALLTSDVFVIKEMLKSASICVSTGDITGVKKLNLPIESVLPHTVDIPYEKADEVSKIHGYKRESFFYKAFSISAFFMMIVQTILLLSSIILEKVGLRAIYRGDLVRNIKNSDLVVSTSDENFKETASLLPINFYWAFTWWSMLASRTLDVMCARSFGKPVIMFPNSIGPFRTWIGRFLSKIALESCSYIFIRDPISYEITNELHINTPKLLTYDTAVLFKSHLSKEIEIFPKPAIGVSPGMYSNSLSKVEFEKYILAHSRVMDKIIEEYGCFIVFLPHYISGFSNDDLEVSKLIIDRMKNKSKTKIVETENASELKKFLESMDIVCSSKMHPAILATTGYVPVFCIAYDHKQTAYFERLGMSDCILNIRKITEKNLLSGINYVWNNRFILEKSLKTQIPQWQKKIKTTIKNVLNYYVNEKAIRGEKNHQLS